MIFPKWMRFTIFYTSFCLFVDLANGDLAEYRLLEYLMRNYNKKIRPSTNHTHATNVTFGLALSQIIDVDEKNQILTSNCWLNQQWVDDKLRWKPEDFGNLRVIRIPFADVWSPDTLLYNNADIMSAFSQVSSHVIVSNNGNITWLSMVIFKSSCSIDVKYFPFDEQNCSMKFASWTYDGFALNLVHNSNQGDDSNYIENSEWELINLTQYRHVIYYSCCSEPYPDVTYYIIIRRRPLFYVFNMMLPCILITLVALLGFYIPSDSGEKVTMGITTLLSMTVFLMLVAESMPPTRNQLPLLGLYYGITIAIVSFATAMTVLTLNIHHKGVRGKEVPWLIKRVCFGFLTKLLCLKLDPPDECITLNDLDIERHDISGLYNEFVPLPRRSIHRMANDANMDRAEVDKLHMPENGAPSMPGFCRTSFSQTRFSSPQTNFNSPETFERQFLRVMQKVYETIERNELRIADTERRDVIKTEWQQVALVVDRLLLWCFVLVTVTVTLAIMLRAPSYFWTEGTSPHALHKAT